MQNQKIPYRHFFFICDLDFTTSIRRFIVIKYIYCILWSPGYRKMSTSPSCLPCNGNETTCLTCATLLAWWHRSLLYPYLRHPEASVLITTSASFTFSYRCLCCVIFCLFVFSLSCAQCCLCLCIVHAWFSLPFNHLENGYLLNRAVGISNGWSAK